jgi:allophanate hydrolase
MDRMGVRLDDIEGVFADVAGLSLVSDAIVPGDIQILGDGTPVVLMRDHQPTGGYPRIATIISADLDRFAQMRPGTRVTFESVTLAHAQNLRTGGGAIR